MYDERSELKKSITLATSSGLPKRFIGVLSFNLVPINSSSSIFFVNSVVIKAGDTQFTLTPFLATWDARFLVYCKTPPLDDG